LSGEDRSLFCGPGRFLRRCWCSNVKTLFSKDLSQQQQEL
jgi:hypothetical protein